MEMLTEFMPVWGRSGGEGMRHPGVSCTFLYCLNLLRFKLFL